MGTFGGYRSRTEIRNELTQHGTYDSCWVGNDLWIIYDGPSMTVPFISLAIVTRVAPDDWTYKPIDEMCGPYRHSCPKSYLDRVPVPPASIVGAVPHQNASDFRERCRLHRARKFMDLMR